MENAPDDNQPNFEDLAPLAPGLYLAATPIGAANDVTLRVLDALRRADALVAEDTRTLRRLMEIHGVQLAGRPLLSYHDRNGPEARPKIMRLLNEGRSVLYASDAGTPLVADPGYRLAEAARADGVEVTALPGPSAVLAGLLASGLPTDAFSFCGFPPTKSAKRRAWLAQWSATPGTLIFFEAPRRLAETLADMASAFGDRQAAVMRELTKKFEETRRGALPELAARYAEEAPPRGEAVVAVGAPPKAAASDRPEALDADVDKALAARMDLESLRDAARTIAEQMGIPRKYAYDRAVALKRRRETGGAAQEAKGLPNDDGDRNDRPDDA